MTLWPGGSSRVLQTEPGSPGEKWAVPAPASLGWDQASGCCSYLGIFGFSWCTGYLRQDWEKLGYNSSFHRLGFWTPELCTSK